MNRLIAFFAAALAFAAAPMTMAVPFSAGGPTDVLGESLLAHAAE